MLFTNLANGKILKYNSGSELWEIADDGGGGGGVALTDLSVTVNSAGTAGLTYNNTTGVFSYTPPDLSGYSTFSGSYNDLTNKPTLFSGSYNDLSDKPTFAVSDLTDVSTTAPSANDVLTWDGSNWGPSASQGGSASSSLVAPETFDIL